jgi:serine/threonine protein kinase
MALTVGQSFADFEILGEVGRGGMGAVYQARQISLQRIVALKILPPHLSTDADSTTRFQAEAIAAASLNHPNIVQVFASGAQAGIRYIAMEFVEGESIQQRLARTGRLPLTEALDVAYHVAAALDYAWQTARLVHRDVKPDNIFLSNSGVVKLGDFGLAKMLREGASSVTATGRAMGSPHFMSPEQAHGQRDLDFRADIYSLGCALHYMATGRLVFEGPDFLSIVLKHVNEEPQPVNTLLNDCPAAFEALLTRMLRKNKEERHASYAELIEDILHARSDAAVWETSDARQRKRMAAEPKSSRPAVLLGVLVVALLVTGYSFLQRSTASRPQWTGVTSLTDPSDRRDFIHSVDNLMPEDRVRRVLDKMREVNPAFDGKAKTTYEDGALSELTISTVGVTNLWPLCALPELRVLRCTGDAAKRVAGNLVDLSPLRELPHLEELDCSWNRIKDLTPVAEAPLVTLRCARTRIQTIAPLHGMELRELDISSTLVRDLSPLRGMPLEQLRCNGTRIRDLSPLQGAPLKNLWCDRVALNKSVVKTWREIETINGTSQ